MQKKRGENMSIESRSRKYGSIFGDWHIGNKLGSGSNGQSAVFVLYRDHEGWREYSALKVISLIEERGRQDAMPQFQRSEYTTASRERRSQAEQEVRLMDQVRGKTNIVDYLDHQFFDWSDESGFGTDLLIRMELLSDLRNLTKKLIQEQKCLSEREIVKIGKDICQALIICHGKQILHRDIKPENIFISKDGDYKLGDFGVSRILSSTSAALASTGIGTPAYSAPEQFTGPYDHRVDIYSLGLVLYELCNHYRLPFAISGYARQEDIQKRQMGTPLPKPAGISEGLWYVLQKACAHQPAHRYHTAQEFLAALSGVNSGRIPVAPDLNRNQTVRAGGTAVQYGTQLAGTVYGGNATQYAQAGNQRSMTGSKRPAAPRATVVQPAPVKKKRKTGLVIGAIAGLAAVITAAVLLLPKAEKEVHEHRWTQATCTAPRTCTECGETQGEALGHNWLAATCTTPGTCETCGATKGKILEHRWLDATCTEPRICQECAATEGEALGHNWSDATCLDPSVCQSCGVTGDNALGHQWIEATYQAPRTCSGCGLTQGEALTLPWNNQTVQTDTGIVAVSAGGWATYALTEKGKVYAIGRDQYGQKNVYQWSGVVKIAAGDSHIAALFPDGTVSAVGRSEHGQCDVGAWRDIVDIYAGTYCTVGICADGTVVLAGQSPEVVFDVSDWADIVQVTISEHFIVGLRSDGTVVYTGGNGHEEDYDRHEYDRNGNKEELATWTGIAQIEAGSYHTLGLRADGTVVVTTPEADEYPDACDVSGWTDIVAIGAGDSFSVGLRRDGTVVVAGDFSDKDVISRWKGNIYTVGSWTDIIQISVIYNQIIGLTKDGYLVACGFNTHGQCDTYQLERQCQE